MYEFKVSVIYIYGAQEKTVLCVVSEVSIFEGVLPTVTSEPAGSPVDPAVRSVCRYTHAVCSLVCFWMFHSDTIHKTLYCE